MYACVLVCVRVCVCVCVFVYTSQGALGVSSLELLHETLEFWILQLLPRTTPTRVRGTFPNMSTQVLVLQALE